MKRKELVKVTNLAIASYYYKFIAYLEKAILDYILEYEIIEYKDYFVINIYVPKYNLDKVKKEYDLINDKFYKNKGNNFVIVDEYLAEVLE
jgi:hypothetical protein